MDPLGSVIVHIDSLNGQGDTEWLRDVHEIG